jgi:hypothetical protein
MDWIRFQILRVGNQPGGVGQYSFSIVDAGWLVSWVVPCFPVEVPVRGDLFSTHLLSGAAYHVSTVPESHSHFHIRHSIGLAFAEVKFQGGHHSLQCGK